MTRAAEVLGIYGFAWGNVAMETETCVATAGRSRAAATQIEHLFPLSPPPGTRPVSTAYGPSRPRGFFN